MYHVLVVDDEAVNLDLLERRLVRAGYRVQTARSAEEARGAIAERRPNLVLLDVCMPEMSGLELLRVLRATPETKLLPVIMVTGLSDTEDIVAAIRSGANDYVTKPINMPVLLARMETHLRISGMLVQLESQARILSELAAYDDLTRVYNRRSLLGALDTQVQRTVERGGGTALLILDIDHFKRVNDTHGHPAGDAVLREFARRTVGAARDTDIVGRYGGEEFCVILPDSDESTAGAVAERVRAAVASAPFCVDSVEIPVTVSIGVAVLPPGAGSSVEGLLRAADGALYAAKEAGRDRVMIAREAGQSVLGGSA